MKNFRCYQLAKELYKAAQGQPVKGAAKDQLVRASLSVYLNLIEGTAKQSPRERRRFFYISLGSLREVQALSDLHDLKIAKQADVLGAHIYKLIQALE